MADMLTRLTSVEVSDDEGSTWAPVGGIKDSSMTNANDLIDSTDNDSGGHKESEYGESQMVVSINGNADESDPGLTKLQTAFQSKTKIHFRARSRTAPGARQCVAKALIGKFDLTNGGNDIVKYSIEITSSGAPTYSTQ